jgi:outer membrane protein OmpA-like peptidoglycan-associated protein
MKRGKSTEIIVLMIFISLQLFIDNGLSEFRHSRKQESIQKNVEQDSLSKNKNEIIEYFEKSQLERTRGGGNLENTVPLVLNIPFDYASAELTQTAKLQLDELGEAMQSELISGISIKLAGHSDERGYADYNLRLSQKRVESAKNYLMRNYYIQANQIYEIGYGESKPIIKHATTEAEHSVNRRVEISRWEESETDNNSDDLLGGNQKNSDGLLSGSDNFEWGVFHVKDNGTEELINTAGNSTLGSNDKYKIYVKPAKSSYVYIYQEDSNGNGSWLFPRAEIDIKNPLNSEDNWIPSRSQHFSLDDNTGTETIYLVASVKPANDLEAYLKEGSNTEKQTPSDTITFKIKTRGLGSIEDDLKNNMNVTEIKNKNWDFYVEIKFKHK